MSILPCPFCGSTDIVDEDCSNMQTNGTRLACNGCGVMVEGYGGSTCTARATAAWNARVVPAWVSCADRMPDPMTWVLVSDGDNVREDRWYPWQEINGRGLLPTDPRRDSSKAKPKWATYTNVTHWMPLPSAPRTAADEIASLTWDLTFNVELVKIQVAESIVGLMNYQGLNKVEFAKKIDATPAFVTKILSGDNNFTLETMVKVGLALGQKITIRFEPVEVVCRQPYSFAQDWTPMQRGVTTKPTNRGCARPQGDAT